MQTYPLQLFMLLIVTNVRYGEELQLLPLPSSQAYQLESLLGAHLKCPRQFLTLRIFSRYRNMAPKVPMDTLFRRYTTDFR